LLIDREEGDAQPIDLDSQIAADGPHRSNAAVSGGALAAEVGEDQRDGGAASDQGRRLHASAGEAEVEHPPGQLSAPGTGENRLPVEGNARKSSGVG
jgi:hypothetical protein